MDMNMRVKEIRKKLGFNQTDFADRIGLTYGAISDIERGKVKTITEGNIKLICSEFNVNEEWFRTGEGNMFIETHGELINRMMKENPGLNDDIRETLELILDMTPEEQKVVINFAKFISVQAQEGNQ